MEFAMHSVGRKLAWGCDTLKYEFKVDVNVWIHAMAYPNTEDDGSPDALQTSLVRGHDQWQINGVDSVDAWKNLDLNKVPTICEAWRSSTPAGISSPKLAIVTGKLRLRMC